MRVTCCQLTEVTHKPVTALQCVNLTADGHQRWTRPLDYPLHSKSLPRGPATRNEFVDKFGNERIVSEIRRSHVDDYKLLLRHTLHCNMCLAHPCSIMHSFRSADVDQIAYDWLSRNWYLLDEVHESISVCSHDNGRCVLLRDTDLKGVKSLAVDPVAG